MAELLGLLGKIGFKDNGEPLVDLRKVLKKARFIGQGLFLLRQTAAQKLLEAIPFLPQGYLFRIQSAYRTREEQERIWEKTYQALRQEHPKLPKEKLKKIVDTLVIPAYGNLVPFHLTGGAIDLLLVSPAGRKVEMINREGDWSKEAETNYPGLHRPIKRNRKLLIEVMTKAGFVNYPKEYWHWSYGDHLWALLKNKPYAIYGALEKTKKEPAQPRLI